MLFEQQSAQRLILSPLRGSFHSDRYRPSCWHGPYCGWRLVEAFRTLVQMPSRFGPMLWGSTWPAYRHEWGDVLAQYEADSEDLEQRAYAQNRVRLHPSAEAIGFMEEALSWQARYLIDRPIIARSVGRIALLRARGLDFDQVARRMRRSIPRLKTINRNGLDTIASGLNHDQIKVF
jgi:hypothetical protein